MNPLKEFVFLNKVPKQNDFFGYQNLNINSKSNKKKSLLAQALPLDKNKISKYYQQKSRKNCTFVTDPFF